MMARLALLLRTMVLAALFMGVPAHAAPPGAPFAPDLAPAAGFAMPLSDAASGSATTAVPKAYAAAIERPCQACAKDVNGDSGCRPKLGACGTAALLVALAVPHHPPRVRGVPHVPVLGWTVAAATNEPPPPRVAARTRV